MHSKTPAWATGHFPGDRKRPLIHLRQHRLAVICWLLLALTIFIPAIISSLDEGAAICRNMNE